MSLGCGSPRNGHSPICRISRLFVLHEATGRPRLVCNPVPLRSLSSKLNCRMVYYGHQCASRANFAAFKLPSKKVPYRLDNILDFWRRKGVRQFVVLVCDVRSPASRLPDCNAGELRQGKVTLEVRTEAPRFYYLNLGRGQEPCPAQVQRSPHVA